MKTEYLLYGKSDFDFDDRSEERMRVLNENLRKKIEKAELKAANSSFCK